MSENFRGAIIALLAIVVFATSFLIGSSRRQQNDPENRGVQSGSFQDPSLTPVYTQAEAISRTIEFVPVGHNYSAVATRLIERDDLLTGWFQETDPWLVSDVTSGPLWLVGMLGQNLVMSDTLRVPGVPSIADDTTPVDGLFAIWDANAGQMIMAGPLDDGQPYTYNMLLAMPNKNLTISHATALPGFYPPTDTPESPPSPTP